MKWVNRKGCGPAGGQWDNQDSQAAVGSVKDCGGEQGCEIGIHARKGDKG
ncbi:MAG: hypothetical protein ACT6FG_06465 [Methanosarcinaceae archaeon]